MIAQLLGRKRTPRNIDYIHVFSLRKILLTIKRFIVFILRYQLGITFFRLKSCCSFSLCVGMPACQLEIPFIALTRNPLKLYNAINEKWRQNTKKRSRKKRLKLTAWKSKSRRRHLEK